MTNGAIIQDSGFVKSDATAMYAAGELQLLRVEIVPARAVEYLRWLVPEYDLDAVRGIQNRGVTRQICTSGD
jgi:hypothetical protein